MTRRIPIAALPGLACAALALAGCATVANGPPGTAGSPGTAHPAAAEKPHTAPTRVQGVPRDVSAALMPPVQLGGGRPGSTVQTPPSQQRFDIDVHDMPAQEFFMGLVKGTPYNMVVSPDVKGRVSLTLKNVTIPEVMRTVQDVYGYDYRRAAAGYQVLPAALQTRIFHVNYLDVVRDGDSRTRVSSGQSTNEIGPNGERLQPGGYGTGGTNQTQESVGLAGSEIQTTSKSDFWKSLKGSLDALIGTKDGRKVVINAGSGLVVVRAMPNELREVHDFLGRLQKDVQREVVLEAKILEVTLNRGFQAGINWGALSRHGSDSYFAGEIAGQNLFANGASDLAGTPLTIRPGTSNPFTGFQSSAIGGTFAMALNLSNFNAVIELLQSQGAVNVLSSPRVATVNNQKAVIKVGSDEFFVTGVTNNTITGTATTSNQNIQLTPFFSGIALDVTPEIAHNGTVILHVHPTVSQVTDQNKQLTVGGQKQSLPLALSNVRESDSIVRAANGQVVVIGGLMQDKTQTTHYSTPILGDIPVLGNLFRQVKHTKEKSELVILLKPVVVNNPDVWKHQIAGAQRNAHQVNPEFKWPDDGSGSD